MKILSSLEIKAVVEELQYLADSKVDQIYQPNDEETIISLHKTEMGKRLLRIIPGTALYITTKKAPSPKEQLNFCRFLRKRLDSTRLMEVVQKNFERIVEFHFKGKETSFILIAEFFSKGNLILCDKDYMIISALKVQLWKDRKIKAKVKYEYPPAKNLSFDSFEDFRDSILASNKENIVKTLAMNYNLGGMYAEELCARTGVDKKSLKLEDSKIKRLFEELNKLLEEEICASMIVDNPVPFKMVSLPEGKNFSSFNEALDVYYGEYIETEGHVEEVVDKSQKYKDLLVDQEYQMQTFEKSVEENKIRGDYIYNHYMEIQELVDLFKAKKYDEIKKKGAEVEGKNLLIEI